MISFVVEYYAAWSGTDEDRIMSYYAENVTIQFAGRFMQGHSAMSPSSWNVRLFGPSGHPSILNRVISGRFDTHYPDPHGRPC